LLEEKVRMMWEWSNGDEDEDEVRKDKD